MMYLRKFMLMVRIVKIIKGKSGRNLIMKYSVVVI